MLTVIQRPQKEIYSEYPQETYILPYQISRWNAGHLPMVYKIQTDKWPNNQISPIATLLQVNSNGGLAEIFISGTYEEYERGDFLLIESDNVSYNGVKQVIRKVSAQQYVINVNYTGDATGDVQYYFNNYRILVKLFAGIQPEHPFQSIDPLTEIAVLSISPSPENISSFDIAPLVRQKLKFLLDNTQSSLPLDLNLWTSLYIQYAESYDLAENGIVNTFTSEYETDVYEECNPEGGLDNPSFDGSLSPWTNYSLPGGSNWTHTTGAARWSNSAPEELSNTLKQDFTFFQGVQYELTVEVDASLLGRDANLYIDFFVGGVFYSSLTVPLASLGSATIVRTFTPTQEYSGVGFHIYAGGTGPSDWDILNANIAFFDSGCIAYVFGSNSTKQFKDPTGGNMGQYTCALNDQGINARFLTFFERNANFGEYLDLSIIIPQETSDYASNANGFYLEKISYDVNQLPTEREWESVMNKGWGVYRIPVTPLSEEDFSVQLFIQEPNSITSAYGGTFGDIETGPITDGVTVGADIPDSSFNIDGIAPMVPYSGPYAGVLEVTADPNDYNPGQYVHLEGIPVEQGVRYVIRIALRAPSVTGVLTSGTVYLLPEGYTIADCLYVGSMQIENKDEWFLLETSFVANATEIKHITIIFASGVSISQSVTGADILWMQALEYFSVSSLSEQKFIDNFSECEGLYLTWLNSLGGYEYWKFSGNKDYETRSQNSSGILRNVESPSEWDENFIENQFERDYINLDNRKALRVPSQLLTGQQMEGIRHILTSINVLDFNRLEGVLIDRESWTYKTDEDKNYLLTFGLEYSSPIRTQSK